MSKRLGEFLVEAVKITETQLQRALTAQLVFGGHLGTSLLELGYLDEETLGKTLSGIFKVSYTDFDELSKAPYAVIRTLPAKLVEKHKVVPLGLEDKTLHLAMIDPTNLLALDEISFVTEYRLAPTLSPEVRILQSLEKYYNIPRSQRFVTLSDDLARLVKRTDKLSPLENEDISLHDETRPRRRGKSTAVTASHETVPKVADTAKITVSPPPAPVGTLRSDEQYEAYYAKSWEEVAEDLGHEVTAQPAPAAEPRVMTLETVVKQLTSPNNVEEVFTRVIGYISERLSNATVFVARGSEIAVWSEKGERGATADRRFAIQDTVLSLLPAGGSHYLGPLPRRNGIMQFYSTLGIPLPRTVLIIPIVVQGKIAAYLYADGGDQEILAIDLPSILSLCERAGFALQILIMQNKILAG